MELGRLNNGERISSISAILLFVFMFLHWFGVKAINTSNLLFAIQSIEPGKSAWEALEYIPIVLVITIIATLAVAALRLTNAARRTPIPVNAAVAILGLVSALLILYRIVDPPIFNTEPTITIEGAVQFPIFLALAAAAGIAFGGCLAMYEEGRTRRSGEPTGEHGIHASPDLWGCRLAARLADPKVPSLKPWWSRCCIRHTWARARFRGSSIIHICHLLASSTVGDACPNRRFHGRRATRGR